MVLYYDVELYITLVKTQTQFLKGEQNESIINNKNLYYPRR